MAVVFILGLLVSSLMERRAEVASVFNNKRTVLQLVAGGRCARAAS